MDNKKIYKKYFYIFLGVQLFVLLLIALAMIFVDPYFHYHKPNPLFSYRLYEERYINDGISRYFDFNGIITGTSMNQNFKTSEAEALFGGSFVKEPFSGAAFLELTTNLEKTFDRNPDVNKVIWGLDYNGLRRDADFVAYNDTPEYLYDNNIFNDVNYVFNKEILYSGLFNTVMRTLQNEEGTSFDEYSSWDDGETGFEHILLSYDREEVRQKVASGEIHYEADIEKERSYRNITQNIIPLIEAHPDIDFYLFYSPYCILYWDSLDIEGTMDMQFDAEEMTTDLLLQYDNVHLFCFYENTDLICNLDNYKNKEHYMGHINSEILKWMANGEYEITLENKDAHLQHTRDFYKNYNYDALFNK